ncbi:hypothetical protein E3N88_43908 [Mikania micrantha]|uniref:Wound-responsive family protein n=1 Tax=Mikania micrantha TaxID=192012 RepID=A0A5N6LFS1_9ASTR|nr:hypothetical protein E3N88_43908 [Mikania micrantha]
MSSTSRAWMVAGTVGLVEALKDQGFARWNYTIRSIHHHAKANLRSLSQSKKLASPATMASTRGMEETAKRSEESLRKEGLHIDLDLQLECHGDWVWVKRSSICYSQYVKDLKKIDGYETLSLKEMELA